MDDWLSSSWDHPNGGVCGTMDWADLISSVDPNIQAIGAKDNSDANGTQGVGDVYWTVGYYCQSGQLCTTSSLKALFSNILQKIMPGTSTSVIQAMRNWGLALSPSYPNGPGNPWEVPSYRGNGAVLQMIVPMRGRITAG